MPRHWWWRLDRRVSSPHRATCDALSDRRCSSARGGCCWTARTQGKSTCKWQSCSNSDSTEVRWRWRRRSWKRGRWKGRGERRVDVIEKHLFMIIANNCLNLSQRIYTAPWIQNHVFFVKISCANFLPNFPALTGWPLKQLLSTCYHEIVICKFHL